MNGGNLRLDRAHWTHPGCIALIALATASCGGGSGSEAESVQPDVEALSIARQVYGIEPSVPADFYVDVDPYPDRQTLTVHVRENEIRPSSQAMDFEACSDDFAEALDWSATQAAQRGLLTTLAGTSESEWYFQFDREVQEADPAMFLNRVFKCRQFDRSAITDGHVGHINRQPVNAADLKFMVEYLWGFSEYNNAFHAVVSSRADSGATLSHTIVRAEAIRQVGAERCDLIETWSHSYSVSEASGLISEQVRYLDVFRARLRAGSAELCDD